MGRRRYEWLDLMRGVAAFSVMIYHFKVFFPVGSAFGASYLAVDLFFVLSGFVLSYAFGPALQEGMSLSRYLLARVIRLGPLHVTSVLTGAAYYLVKIPLGIENAPKFSDWSLLLSLGTFWLPNPGWVTQPRGTFPFQPTAWSLLCEMIVSLLFGIVIFRLGARARWVFGLAAFVAMIVLSAPWGTIDLGSGWDSLGIGIVRAIAEFTLGAAVQATIPSRGRKSGWPFAALALVIVIGGLVLSPTMSFTEMVVTVLLMLLLLACVPATEPDGMLAWVCSISGRLSYPVYLFHVPIFLWLSAICKMTHFDVTDHFLAFGIALVTLTVLTSACALHFIDRPVRRWLTVVGRPAPTRMMA